MIRVHGSTWAALSLAVAFAACESGPTAVTLLDEAPDGGVPPVATAAPAVHMVPFKFKGNWWYADDGDAGVCDGVLGTVLTLHFAWEGTAAHMGAVTGTNTNCYGAGAPLAQPLLLQTGTITAANGDVLFAYEANPAAAVFADLSFEIGPVAFAGGTGRFEGATGWYRIEAESVAGGPFIMSGELSSVGSSMR